MAWSAWVVCAREHRWRGRRTEARKEAQQEEEGHATTNIVLAFTPQSMQNRCLQY